MNGPTNGRGRPTFGGGTRAGGVTVPSTALTVEQIAVQRAQLLTEHALNRVIGTDFESTGMLVFGGAGTAALSTTQKTTLSQTTGAAAGVLSTCRLVSAGVTNAHIANARTERWYARFVARLTTAVDAQTQNYVGLDGGAATSVAIGLLGPASAAFYTLQVFNGATTNVVTTQAVDLNVWHLFEVWNDGINISAAIDGVTLAATPIANVGTGPQRLVTTAFNGTTAANRGLEVDLMLLVYQGYP